MIKTNGVLSNVTDNDIELLKSNPKEFWSGVTKIGSSAFLGCDNLNNLKIPNGITEIGKEAFRSCENLTSVTIPDGVTEIGDCAFAHCPDLASITIPNSVTFNDTRMFRFIHGIEKITFGNRFTYYNYTGMIELPDGTKSKWSTRLGIYNELVELFKLADAKKIKKVVDNKLPLWLGKDIDNLYLKEYKKLIKKYDEELSNMHYKDFASTAFNLGVLNKGNINVKTTDGERELPISNLASAVLQKILKEIPLQDLNLCCIPISFGGKEKKLYGYNEAFLRFLSVNDNLKAVIKQMKSDERFLSKVYTWFKYSEVDDIISKSNNSYKPQTENISDKSHLTTPTFKTLFSSLEFKEFIHNIENRDNLDLNF